MTVTVTSSSKFTGKSQFKFNMIIIRSPTANLLVPQLSLAPCQWHSESGGQRPRQSFRPDRLTVAA